MNFRITPFLENITQAWIRQLPLFVMFVAYTTIPTFFSTFYSFHTYLLTVFPQSVLPSLLLCLIADRRRWLWWVVFIFGNFLWLTEAGCYFCQGQRMSSYFAILVAQTDRAESSEYLSTAYPSLLKALFAVVLSAITYYIWSYKWRKISEKIIRELNDGLRLKAMRCAGLVLSLGHIFASHRLRRQLQKRKVS